MYTKEQMSFLIKTFTFQRGVDALDYTLFCPKTEALTLVFHDGTREKISAFARREALTAEYKRRVDAARAFCPNTATDAQWRALDLVADAMEAL